MKSNFWTYNSDSSYLTHKRMIRAFNAAMNSKLFERKRLEARAVKTYLLKGSIHFIQITWKEVKTSWFSKFLGRRK